MFLSFSIDVYVIFLYWNILMKWMHFIFICHLVLLTYFWCGKCSRISILFLIIYWCWLFFMCKMFLSFSSDVYVIFLYWNISMKLMHFICICHLHVDIFWCGKCSRISILVLIIYWCWLFFMCKMFLSFSIDVYVIFLYWNILMKWMHFIFICHLVLLTYFWCGKCFRISILFLIIYWCWLFFMCKMFLSFLTDVYVIFLYWNILRSFTDVDIFLCQKCFRISILFLIIYWCWLFFHVQNVLIILEWCLWDFLVLKHIDEVDALHLHLSFSVVDIFLVWKMFQNFNIVLYLFTDVDYFSCAKCSYHCRLMFMWFSCTETYQGHLLHLMLTYIFVWKMLSEFEYCFWCKLFLSFSIDVYVIFLYWNILMKWMHFIFICHLVLLTYFWCGKCSRISILFLIIYWCWLFFMCMWQNVQGIIFFWCGCCRCLCDFLVMKHIDEVDALHLHLSFTDVDLFSCLKMFHNLNTAFVYLLMLIIFHVQNVLFIFDWCLCDFLVLKHIDEVDALHLHLSFSVVDIFLVWKMFQNFNIVFDYLLMLTISSCAKCSYHFRLMSMWFSCTETYMMKWMHFIFICHLVLLTYFWCGKCFRISILFWLFTDVDYFSCAKCSYHCRLMFMWFSCTETYQGHLLMLTFFCVENVVEFEYCFWCKLFLSFSIDVYVIFLYWNILMKWMHFIFICHLVFLTYFWCGKCFRISILFLIIYWCWLFFMCKMFISFLIDVYVIFLYWNILMKWMHFIFICHLVLLTYFCVENVAEFQYCFWLFTDVDYFSCAKCSYHFRLMFMWFSSTETYWGHLLMLTFFGVENVVEFEYCFWCKLFLSFSIDVYVIFL